MYTNLHAYENRSTQTKLNVDRCRDIKTYLSPLNYTSNEIEYLELNQHMYNIKYAIFSLIKLYLNLL